jgi:hypothetical protein
LVTFLEVKVPQPIQNPTQFQAFKIISVSLKPKSHPLKPREPLINNASLLYTRRTPLRCFSVRNAMRSKLEKL